jgi:hypothetical protein
MAFQEKFHPIDVASAAYEKLGLHERAVTELALQTVRSGYDSLAKRIREGQQVVLDTGMERFSIVRSIEKMRTSPPGSTQEIFRSQRTLWSRGPDLAGDILIHTFTGDREQFLADAKVSYLLSSLSLAAWEGANPGDIEGLRAVAKKTLAICDWEGLVTVATEYFESPLAGSMYAASLQWHTEAFSPHSYHGEATDAMITSYAIITKPDAIMTAAQTIYKDVFSLNTPVPVLR